MNISKHLNKSNLHSLLPASGLSCQLYTFTYVPIKEVTAYIAV